MGKLNTQAYPDALARIEALSGCLEGTAEERELILLTQAVKRYEEAILALVETLERGELVAAAGFEPATPRL